MNQVTELTAEEVASTISLFNIPGWIDVTEDQITLSPLGFRYLNKTYKVDRVDESDEGPKSLVFKKYGASIPPEITKDFGIVAPLVQSLIFYEQSKRGWGPKLYGLFDEGRVEELVDCHTLTAEEAFSPEMVKDVAKAYARFHSHKLPIRQKPRDFLVEYISSVDEAKDALREWHSSGETASIGKYPAEDLLEFPFHDEYKWIATAQEKINKRVTLCTSDTSYMNRLVRKEEPGDEDANRTLIIHLDAAYYANRGTDLAGHFIHRRFDMTKKDDKLSGFPLPNEAERTAFFTAYLEECSKLFDDFDPDSLDSIENVTLEVDLALCTNLVADLIFFMKYGKIIPLMDPALATMVAPQMEIYKEVKEAFFQKHPDLVN